MPFTNKRLFKHSTTFYRRKQLLEKQWSINILKRTVEDNDITQPKNVVGESSNKPEGLVSRHESQSLAPEDESESVNSEEEFMTDYQKNDVLKSWCVSNKITHASVNELLNIMTTVYNIKYLPKDARTFLCTPITKNREIREMGSGKYWHNGLRNSLITALQNTEVEEEITLQLTFNIDGLPLYKSAREEFWPILCRIDNMPKMKPMFIGIYSGVGKPPCNDFLKTFVDELSECIHTGVTFKNGIAKIKINCFICDTPARAFIKGTVGSNAYHGCLRCSVIGEYDHNGRHMSFPRTDAQLRTDSSFRNRIDHDHHKMDSVLEKLPIDMVKDFVVADSLHLLDLGIMKKLLMGWTRGGFNFYSKFSARDIIGMSKMLIECNKTMPKEIHRAVRGLDTLAFWKGLEFRTVLLYVGPVILKNYLPEDAYAHYLHLFCAIRICSSDVFFQITEYRQVAEGLIKDFIEQYITLYGLDSISSNIHNLCHLIDDVNSFGILPKISAYPFENMLYFLKKLLRSGKHPLSQVANRLTEMMECDGSTFTNTINEKAFPFVSKLIKDEVNKYSMVNFKDFVLCNNNKNKWFLTDSNEVIQTNYATKINNNLYINGNKILYLHPFFNYPLNSTLLKVFQSDGNICNKSMLYPVKNIICKMIELKYMENIVFIPLLHSFEH